MKLTRQKYLKKIQDCIMALPLEEQKEVMDYYTNYFEDAGDDEKVMEELGSPEDVAKVIRERFSNTLVKDSNTKTDDDKEESSSGSAGRYEALYYEFKNSALVLQKLL